jgi:hypothetical protein
VKRYRVLLPLLVHTEDGAYGQGEVFEKEFSEEEERANLASGLLELVPESYEVVGPRNVLGHAPGEKFEASLSIGQERMLVQAGHIKHFEVAAVKPKPKRRADKES